jgi:hypothetical protein
LVDTYSFGTYASLLQVDTKNKNRKK